MQQAVWGNQICKKKWIKHCFLYGFQTDGSEISQSGMYGIMNFSELWLSLY